MRRDVLAVALAATACAGQRPLARLDVNRPITVVDAPLGHGYRQDGVALDVDDVVARLGERDATRGDAGAARSWSRAGQIFGYAGGLGIGFGVGSLLGGGEARTSLAVAGGGAALAGVAMLFAHAADARLERGVRAHNASLAPPPSARAPVEVGPWLDALTDGRGRCTPTAGVTVAY